MRIMILMAAFTAVCLLLLLARPAVAAVLIRAGGEL